MREIKFRAWDKENNCWFEQKNPQGNAFNNYYIDFEGWLWKEENIKSKDPDKNDSFSRGEFILMQYTGLKDKNGKEIYEGDIVKAQWYNAVIEWSEDRAGFVGITKGIEVGLEVPERLEIIGNIYENPELLK